MASHYPPHAGPSGYYMQPPQAPNNPPIPQQQQQQQPYYPQNPTGPNGYPYHPHPQYAVPMQQQQHQGMPPPRAINGRGGPPNGNVNGNGYTGRGAPYAPPPPHPNAGYRPPYAYAHALAPPPPPPQMGPGPKYGTHPQQQAYVPHPHQPQYGGNMYPPPQSPAWQQHQPPQSHQLSPLPLKDLALSPLSPRSPLVTPTAYYSQNAASAQVQNDTPTQENSTVPDAEAQAPASSSSYTTMGSISSEASIPSASPTSHDSGGGGGWTISAHRPHDPADAPGVMIAPWAHPPRLVVEMAVVLASPVRATAVPTAVSGPKDTDADRVKQEAEHTQVQEQQQDVEHKDDPTTAPATDSTPTTTTAPTLPGSPADSASVSSSAATSVSAPVETAEAEKASAVEPAPTPTPAPLPPKKSWASLLRAPAASTSASTSALEPASGSASAPARPKQKPLPTSTQVGFSVPAPGPSEASLRAERGVLGLLTSTPAALSPTTPAFSSTTPTALSAGAAVTPRGLINTGNMCFANAVLQTLVYCAPFGALFAGLYSVLGPQAVGADDTAGAGAARGGGMLEGAPLVRATGAFLKEFQAPARRGSVGANGERRNGNGKGKAQKEDEEEEEREAFIPTGIYDALKGKKRFDNMRGGHQEDAEEFLGFFLDTLEEELLAVVAALSPSPARPPPTEAQTQTHVEEAEDVGEDGWLEVGRKNRTVVMRTIKSAESPITRIFGGKLRSTLRAPGQKDSVVVEDWRSLRLDIQHDAIHSISDALAFIAHPQPVQLTHPASSTTSSTSSHAAATLDASQQVLLDGGALPPVLVLHVKRFYYDTAVGGVVKVGKRVEFGAELDIGSDVMTPAAAGGRKAHVRYKLFGVIYHHGASASGGHYTLDVLHPTRFGPPADAGSSSSDSTKSEGWVRIDDELVSDVRPGDVFSPEAQMQGEREGRCAYLLFYRRVR
ncbi:hypothetical protein C8R46DRAFT_1076315 [Mycena filopes]|nr:hypothetical protein C8R46DRAFT_1076315 [Mycena filopes]